MAKVLASDIWERELCELGYDFVIGVDEVGRGAIAGPVSVGVAIRSKLSPPAPVDLADSKELTPRQRHALLEPIANSTATAVGHCWPEEIDAVGIMEALNLAAHRALAQLRDPWKQGKTLIIVDGTHQWLSVPTGSRAELITRAKADRDVACVAAASVVAKVTRDTLMTENSRRNPAYGWDRNKGYASLQHTQALTEWGISDFHRKSWKLPGIK